MGAGLNNTYKEKEVSFSTPPSIPIWVIVKSVNAEYAECVGHVYNGLSSVMENKWHSTLETWSKFYMYSVTGIVKYERNSANQLNKISFILEFPPETLNIKLFKGLKKAIKKLVLT